MFGKKKETFFLEFDTPSETAKALDPKPVTPVVADPAPKPVAPKAVVAEPVAPPSPAALQPVAPPQPAKPPAAPKPSPVTMAPVPIYNVFPGRRRPGPSLSPFMAMARSMGIR